MKIPFIQPRFDGDRFDEHTLPLEVTADLTAYQNLVIELAKRLYLSEHPARQRVPKGFGADFQLHLEKVDDGSAKPLLSIVTAGALALTSGQPYFERARELVELCIASADGSLPAEFPKDLLSHFNRLGRSLKEGEKMELGAAALTPERRKRLVLAADKTYERDIESVAVSRKWIGRNPLSGSAARKAKPSMSLWQAISTTRPENTGESPEISYRSNAAPPMIRGKTSKGSSK